MKHQTQVGQDWQDDALVGQEGTETNDDEGLGPVRREYPAVLSAKQLEAIAGHYLKNCQSAWRPNPDRKLYDPDKDLVYETLFADEILDSRADAIREGLGISAEEAIYVLWDKKLSSFFKTFYESVVICDSGIYYRTKNKSGRLGWMEIRALPARAIRGGGNTLVLNDMVFTCQDAGALMMLLQKIRSELIYARNWPKRKGLTFATPSSRARRVGASEIAVDILRREASESVLHTKTEFCDPDEYLSDVRLYLDIPGEDVIYAAYEWSYDSDNPFPETNRELPPSFGAFAFAQNGFYVCVDDGYERGSHTRLVSWDEFAEVMDRDFVSSPDGSNSLVFDGTLFGNLGEGVNLYPRLISKLCDALETDM